MINSTKLRVMIGWLGMLLPWVVLVLSLIFENIWPSSISYTYFYDSCITPFMIILGSAALLLFTYEGYDKQDRIISTLSGVFALGVCLFPTTCAKYTHVGTFQVPTQISGAIHNGCAIGFFALLAYNSYFLFTKSAGEMTRRKKIRNLIYKVCGVGMLGSFALMIPFEIFDVRVGTWIMEAVALMFFGISWLTKSQYYSWLFADEEGAQASPSCPDGENGRHIRFKL